MWLLRLRLTAIVGDGKNDSHNKLVAFDAVVVAVVAVVFVVVALKRNSCF